MFNWKEFSMQKISRRVKSKFCHISFRKRQKSWWIKLHYGRLSSFRSLWNTWWLMKMPDLQKTTLMLSMWTLRLKDRYSKLKSRFHWRGKRQIMLRRKAYQPLSAKTTGWVRIRLIHIWMNSWLLPKLLVIPKMRSKISSRRLKSGNKSLEI